MRLMLVLIEEKLDLSKCNIIFYHADCFCLQEKKGRLSQKYFLFPILRRPPQQKEDLF